MHFVGPDSGPLFAFQTFDYLRAFFNNRIGWARLKFMLCAVGAFQIWRRDLLEELGGWSREFTCEDIEFTFRVHQSCASSDGSPIASRACPTGSASPRARTRCASSSRSASAGSG